MDAKKLGQFIADRRKTLGYTQADLAEKLHVTDKAVSRWERGLGLPDINTIEPLSNALNVSMVEVMRAELITEALSDEDTSDVIKDVLTMVEKKRAERRSLYIISGSIALLVALVLLIDNLGVLPFIGVFLTTFGLLGGIILIVVSICRKQRRLPCKATLITGIILLLIPISFIIFMLTGFLMGAGPT